MDHLLLLRRSTRTRTPTSWARRDGSSEPTDDLDRWALSRTAGTAELVAERLDAYDATTAGRAIAELVEDLSNWYVRRSRRRFWDGDPAAFATLRTCLLTVAKLLAPFCPFIADEIYDNLDGELRERAPVRLPAGAAALPARDEELEQAMALARETVRLGLGARGKAKIKVRQPLGEAVVVADGREREAIERLADIVREELNVKRVRFVAAAEELGSYEVKANYRTLGPLFGKRHAARGRRDRGARPGAVAAALRDGADGESIGIAVGGREHTLSAEDVILDDARRPRATASSARARTRSRSTWRSTTSCARRDTRARSSTRCRTRARAPASRSRTGSSSRSAATTRCSTRGATRTATTSPARRSRSSLGDLAPTRSAPEMAARRAGRQSTGCAAAAIAPARAPSAPEHADQAAVSAGSSSCSSFFLG